MVPLDRFGNNVTYKIPLPGGQARLKEAALYVMRACENLPYFGLVKLNKMLWKADFQSYLKRRLPVTGRQYQKLENGPAPVEMLPLLRELLREQLVELRETEVPNEQRPIALVPPVMNFFSADDLHFLDAGIAFFASRTSRETSDMSHGMAWGTREIGDPIPYQAAFFDDRPLPEGFMHKLAALAKARELQTL